MRKTYMEGNIEVAFGLDHATGFFLQIFKNDNLVVDLDQSRLYGLPLQPSILTYQKARQVISEHCPNAIRKFELFVKEANHYRLEPALKGSLLDENGEFSIHILLFTNEELQAFLGNLDENKPIMLTDIFDRLIYKKN